MRFQQRCFSYGLGALGRMLALSLLPATACAQTRGSNPASAARTPVPGAPPGVTAFVGVSVIPMDTERVLANQTVLVEGGRITALGATGQVKVPAGATRIDGKGQYLIPGLADMHAHLPSMEDMLDGRVIDTTAVGSRLFLWLANGVTTIRAMDYIRPEDGPVALRMRARAAAGRLWSPRIYTAGRWQLDPRASIVSQVAAYKAAGYDLIKVRDEPPKVWDSLTKAARQVGIPFAGHIPERGIELDQGLQAGYASIEHLTKYLEYLLAGREGRPRAGAQVDATFLAALRQQLDLSKIPAIAAATQRAGVWNTPTQALAENVTLETSGETLLQWPELQYLSPAARKRATSWAQNKPPTTAGDIIISLAGGTLGARRQLIKALQDSGAGLLLGSDAPAGLLMPGFGVHRELAALVRAGLTPYQALLTGTRNVAQYFGTLEETGTVAVGKRADLVLLRENPLSDIENTAHPAGVMVGGRWLAREAIDRRLAELVGKL
jgi:hypothetical protein